MRTWIALIVGAAAGAVIWGCAMMGQLSVNQQIELGERKLEWGLVYYRSWLQDREGDYLNLARRHTASAVVNFFELQLELGHAYPVFYDIDKRRRQGCRFLREIDREARRNGVSIDDGERVGCRK